jgi:hypothetical protein
VSRNEINIFNLSGRLQNNGLNWIRHVEEMEPERIPNSEWTVHLEEQVPLKTKSYAGRINLSYWEKGWTDSLKP